MSSLKLFGGAQGFQPSGRASSTASWALAVETDLAAPLVSGMVIKRLQIATVAGRAPLFFETILCRPLKLPRILSEGDKV